MRFIRNTATFRGFFVLAAAMLPAVGTARNEARPQAPHAPPAQGPRAGGHDPRPGFVGGETLWAS